MEASRSRAVGTAIRVQPGPNTTRSRCTTGRPRASPICRARVDLPAPAPPRMAMRASFSGTETSRDAAPMRTAVQAAPRQSQASSTASTTATPTCTSTMPETPWPSVTPIHHIKGNCSSHRLANGMPAAILVAPAPRKAKPRMIPRAMTPTASPRMRAGAMASASVAGSRRNWPSTSSGAAKAIRPKGASRPAPPAAVRQPQRRASPGSPRPSDWPTRVAAATPSPVAL